MSGFFNNLFTPAAPAPAPAPAPVGTPPNQGNIPGAPTVASDPNNPTAPEGTAAPAPSNEPQSPLDQFSSLWETKPNEAGEPEAPKQLTAQEVQTAMAKADFSKVINTDQLAAITAGGQEAAEALPQILNALARQVMTQSTLVSDKLTQQAVAQALEKQQASLPSLLREQQAANHLKTSNPLFDNPAIKPVVEATRTQLLAKHPNASHEDITKMTQEYIVAMGEAFAPKQEVTQAADDVDWAKYLTNT